MAAEPAAHAASGSGSGIPAVADALKKNPVYVDPRASSQLTSSDAEALAKKIKDSGKPVFVAVLPAAPEFPPKTLLQDLRAEVGITGVYAVHLGNGFNAGADPQVMPHTAVLNLTGALKRSYGSDTAGLLNAFADQADQQAAGHAPDSWGSSGGGGGSGAAIAAGVVVVAGAGGGYALYRRSRKRKAEREQAALDRLRTVIDEDITAFGEELDRLDFNPSATTSDDAMRRDYEHALDCYDRAKAAMAAARRPDDVQQVTEALEDGRFSLATLEARRSGAPLPERRLPCFFDPRHGPSVRDVEWAPAGGAVRSVPACAADAARLADGEEPMTRTVQTASGPQPYWDAGPAYAPWAGGYFGGFGGGLLPGLLVGTMLGSAMSAPYAYADTGPGFDGGWDNGGDGWGDAGGPQGGDYSGADFNPADFSGGFGDVGDSGGFGDFGGGGDSGGGFGGGDW
ncbi:hypothetical protein NGB36_14155 [Streptomyces sp. RB6PN25]|uniref:DUF5129 domain-containing protein n=2 Tax=Streptomyces humicola TaxID=2953240 RepID=A0ABT1PVN1_9ACTN|nr:hypothetical protein [Streptomyces humicola]MCQ4081720.1 hypothetical protein [Streptomyces humicola]